jgi:hypothetical protein
MRKVSTLVGLALLVFASSARAQEEAPAAAPAGDPAAAPAGDAAGAPAPAPEAAAAPAAGTDYVSRGLTVAGGGLQLTVPIVLTLNKGAALKPVWVPLDVRYGVNDQLEVFLLHSGPGYPMAAEGGVCLGGTSRGCGKLYNNATLGAQYSLSKSGGIELTGIGALELRSLDPMWLAIDIGVGFKYASGPIAIKATPVLGIGATKRADGNKEFIAVPVQIAFQASAPLAVFLDTGIGGPTSHFGDLYSVPLGIGAAFAVQPGLDVGAEFMIPGVLTGIPGDKALDSRTLALFASYRTK